MEKVIRKCKAIVPFLFHTHTKKKETLPLYGSDTEHRTDGHNLL